MVLKFKVMLTHSLWETMGNLHVEGFLDITIHIFLGVFAYNLDHSNFLNAELIGAMCTV